MHNEYYQLLTAEMKRQLFKPNTKRKGDFVAPIDCPLCGKKDKGYAHADRPDRFFCSSASCEAHKDNGGKSMKELLNFDFNPEKKYKNDPDKIWRSYLNSRGLYKTLKNLPAKHWSNIRKTCKGGVMVPAGKNIDGDEVLIGRIYSPKDNNKSHMTKKITGCVFKHPAIEHDVNEPLYLCEGWLNTLSFEEMNLQSMAIISTNQDPKAIEHHIKPYRKLVLCFDWDSKSPAGTNCCRKYQAHFPDAEVIFLDLDTDANDLLIKAGSAEKALATFKANYQNYINNGKLALATNAFEYGRLNYELFSTTGLFEFNGSTYYSNSTKPKNGEAPNVVTKLCGNFTVSTLYTITQESGADTYTFKYKLELKPIDAKPIRTIATAKDLNGAKEFNNLLMNSCSAVWDGSRDATASLQRKLVTHHGKRARQLELYGFDRTSQYGVSHNWAVSPDGKFHLLDDHGLFEISNKEFISPTQAGQSDPVVMPSSNPKHSIQEIFTLFDRAFPVFGAISFSWLIGCLFLDELKFSKLGFWPFLSIAGHADCGKSSMVEELTLYQGWDDDGRDLSDSSSTKGIARELYGAANMFRAILEITDETEKILSRFINILGAYNRGGGSVKAAFTNDNTVNRSDLYCGLLFCSNHEFWKNKQQKSRAVSLLFTDEYLNEDTAHHYNILQTIPKADKASVLVSILKKRKEFISRFDDEYKLALQDLSLCPPGRIKNNYAALLANYRIFSEIFDIHSQFNLYEELDHLSLEKHEDSKRLALNPSGQFFENISNVESEEIKKYFVAITDPEAPNHGIVYIALAAVHRELSGHGFTKPERSDIESAFLQHPAYISHGKNYNFKTGYGEDHKMKYKRRKAWRFNAKKLRETENLDFQFYIQPNSFT